MDLEQAIALAKERLRSDVFLQVVIRERLEYYDVDYYQRVFRSRELAQDYINSKYQDINTRYEIIEECI